MKCTNVFKFMEQLPQVQDMRAWSRCPANQQARSRTKTPPDSLPYGLPPLLFGSFLIFYFIGLTRRIGISFSCFDPVVRLLYYAVICPRLSPNHHDQT